MPIQKHSTEKHSTERHGLAASFATSRLREKFCFLNRYSHSSQTLKNYYGRWCPRMFHLPCSTHKHGSDVGDVEENGGHSLCRALALKRLEEGLVN